MCDNARECASAREHGFGTPPDAIDVPEAASVRPAATLADKIGLRPGQRVALVCVTDPDVPAVARDIASATTALHSSRPFDLVIYQVENVFSLRRIPELAGAMADTGALWVLWPRGVEHVRQTHVQKAGTAAGLVDVKMASVGGRLSGLRFEYRSKLR
ncbi:MAG: hypothetical protein ACYC77_11180 [Coriobacteriia bacterium]